MIFKNFKTHFFTGILVVTPMVVIGWILGSAASLLWKLQEILPLAFRPETLPEDTGALFLLKLFFTIFVSVFLGFVLATLGWLSKQYFGKKVIYWLETLIARIPLIRGIYSALDQLLKSFASGSSSSQFNRVVYVEYPRPGIWTLAFVTSPHKSHALGSGYLNLFVPTTPNPTSGFYLIVNEKDVRESHLKVEEAFKTILSLGIVTNGS